MEEVGGEGVSYNSGLGIKEQSLFNQGQLTLSQYANLIIPRLTASCPHGNGDCQERTLR